MKTSSRKMLACILVLFSFHLLDSEQCSALEAKIDWLQGYVSATGRGYAKKTGTPLDVENAVDAAKVVAQGELLEAIKGVMIDNQTAVSDLMSERTETSVRVQGVLQGSQMVGEPQTKEVDGFVVATVKLRVCLFNRGAGCISEKPLVSAMPKSPVQKNKPEETCSLLPNVRSTQEILSKITFDTSKPLKIFIVNLNGAAFNTETKDFLIGFEPNPGQKCTVYGPDKIDPAVRRDRGAAEIFLHLSDTDTKYGSNKVTVSAISVDENNYIIIDKNDAYLLQLLNDHESNVLFREARVGILIK